MSFAESKQPGTTTIALSKNEGARVVREASKHCAELRHAGHAVVLDVTFEADGVLSEARIFHYLTCNACSLKT
jgi:hypothetical protein